LFRISKISTFESNSQQSNQFFPPCICCSEYQRYQLLRAIHNSSMYTDVQNPVVPNIKDINFWEQFTTNPISLIARSLLFRISKISTFESNSQPPFTLYSIFKVVPNIKDINFWEQFTTAPCPPWKIKLLFRISKISTFESNSQRNRPRRLIN